MEILFLSHVSLVGMSSIPWTGHHQLISHYFGMSPSALDGYTEYGVWHAMLHRLLRPANAPLHYVMCLEDMACILCTGTSDRLLYLPM